MCIYIYIYIYIYVLPMSDRYGSKSRESSRSLKRNIAPESGQKLRPTTRILKVESGLA